MSWNGWDTLAGCLTNGDGALRLCHSPLFASRRCQIAVGILQLNVHFLWTVDGVRLNIIRPADSPGVFAAQSYGLLRLPSISSPIANKCNPTAYSAALEGSCGLQDCVCNLDGCLCQLVGAGVQIPCLEIHAIFAKEFSQER